MFERVYELLMSIITFILGLFGIELGKKSVTFADDVIEATKTDDVKEEVIAPVSTDMTESA